MHELSLCEAIADVVLEAAAGRAVRRVDVRVGRLRQVVPQTLAFCWEAWCAGGPLAGADLVLEDVPARLACRDCGAHTDVEDDLLLACGRCDSVAVDTVAGDEFLVTSIDVAATGEAVHTNDTGGGAAVRGG